MVKQYGSRRIKAAITKSLKPHYVSDGGCATPNVKNAARLAPGGIIA
jgi:hypothetical protein